MPDEPTPPHPAPTRATVGIALRAAGFIAAVLAITTLAIAAVESEAAGQLDGSPLYLVAVVIVATRYRTAAGIATAIAAFLIYNLLFTEPRFTLTVADPREWLNLVLFLFVAVVIGRLAGVSANRADEAEARAREATALYGIARTLAAETSDVALGEAVRQLVTDAAMTRAWITLDDAGRDRVLADSATGPLPAAPPTVQVLMREGAEPRWMGTHAGRGRDRRTGSDRWYRVRLAAGDAPFGSLWASRPAEAEPPDRIETRLLSLAADQVALAVQRDVLRAQAVEAEVARRDAALKSALVDSVSHDLRTPLAGIRAAAGSIADPDMERSPEEVRATATSIEAEAMRLDRMVGALLDLSRIQAGALHARREALDVEDAAGAVIDRLRPLLGGRTIQTAFGEDLPPVEADPTFLDQCLANLVENATRHTPPTSTVTVRAASAGDRVVIEVEDDGPGVSDQVATRLFDRFYRSPAATTRAGGMGVGLTIVRGLAEAMGGTVDAARGTAGGLLRAPDAPGRGTTRRRGGAVSDPGARLLLVEDEAAVSDPTATNLRGHGFRVDVAGSVREALAAWDAERADCILLDLGLPDQDGFAVITRVRRESTVPILVLSARSEEAAKVQALELGADDYVTKPFGLAELRARIGALLRRAGGREADQEGIVRVGPLELDPARRQVRCDGEPLDLTPREYELLKTMLAHRGRLLTKGRLLRAVWGTAYDAEAHYLHVYVSRVRRKLDRADPSGRASGLIVAEPGIGYRIGTGDDEED